MKYNYACIKHFYLMLDLSSSFNLQWGNVKSQSNLSRLYYSNLLILRQKSGLQLEPIRFCIRVSYMFARSIY
uniref:Uncharacterized protein n=1 Tax=Cryptosporidium parvum TaxID=5807 RepID=Q9GNM9_CRYPV|nr:hypothetical protein [Cryptosporidium parvum]